jgi:putative ABC transport system substrate-binding protein
MANDPIFFNMYQQITMLATHYKIPVVSNSRQLAFAGGLASYGPRFDDLYRLLGEYTGRILKGAKPADLPVYYPTQLNLIVNLKTAKALGLTIPPSILARADEVIE